MYIEYCSWSPRTCICQNSKYLKSFVGDSVIEHHQNINFTDSVLTNETNAVSTNVASTVSVTSDDKKSNICN